MVIEHREVFSCRECGGMFEIKASIPSTEVLHCTAVIQLGIVLRSIELGSHWRPSRVHLSYRRHKQSILREIEDHKGLFQLGV